MNYDVIVCGGGPSGITAAISASRNNARVLLVEVSGVLGGASILSLVGPWMTFHNQGESIVGGIAGEFVQKLVDRGESMGHLLDPLGFCDTVTPFDTEGYKALLFEYIKTEQIDLLLHALVFDVIKDNNVIKGVKVMTKNGIRELYANTIVDATGDGDVAKLMECDSVYGRESDHLAQPMTMIFHVADVDLDKMRHYMSNHPGDFVLRKDYDFQYLGVSGFFKKIKEAKTNQDFSIPRDRVLLFQEVRKNQVSINMTRVLNLSGLDPFELSQAEIEGREQIRIVFAFLKKYIPGFEKSYILRTPCQIGVRETRHILGDYLLDVNDVLERRRFDDSVCLSGFPIDIHSPTGNKLEFYAQKNDKALEIPIRTMLPKGADNLIITGRCISATHEAAASLRVTPTAMALGEAAGVLAALAAKANVSPRQIDYHLVQAALIKQGQIVRRSSDEL